MYSLTTVRSADDAKKLATAWNRLHADSGLRDPFLLPWWYEVWFRHSPDAGNARILAVSDGDDLAAVLPVCIGKTRRTGCNARVVSHALNIIADKEQFLVRENCADALTFALDKLNETEPWDVLTLQEVPADSRLFMWFRDLSRRGFSVKIFPGNICPYLPVEGSVDDLWKRIYPDGGRRHNRKTLVNRINRFAAAGEAGFLKEDRYEADSFFGEIQAVERLSWKKGKTGSITYIDWRARFYEDSFLALNRMGALQVEMIKMKDVAAAYSISMRSNGSLLYYQNGYDPAHSKLSIGFVATMTMIQRAHEEGMHEVDFGRGIYPYKKELTRHARQNYQVFVFRSPRMAAVYVALRRARKLLKKILRRSGGLSWDGELNTLPEDVAGELGVEE